MLSRNPFPDSKSAALGVMASGVVGVVCDNSSDSRSGYSQQVILRIRHRGLRRFHRRGDTSGLTPHKIPRLLRILTALGAASGPEDLDAPTYRLHPLRGNLAGSRAADVTVNRSLIFRFEWEDVTDVDLLDYH